MVLCVVGYFVVRLLIVWFLDAGCCELYWLYCYFEAFLSNVIVGVFDCTDCVWAVNAG